MSTAAVKALERDLGDLLERHEKGEDTADFRKYADDFVGFVEEGLGETLTDAQRSVAVSVRDEQLTHVQSAHAMGKDWLAGRLALWWALYHLGPDRAPSKRDPSRRRDPDRVAEATGPGEGRTPGPGPGPSGRR